MKFLAVIVVLLVVQDSFAHPHPDPLISSFISTAIGGVNTLVGSVTNAAATTEAAILSTIKSTIPSTSNLIGTVSNITQAVSNLQPLTLVSDLTNIITAANSGSTANIINAVIELIDSNGVLNSTVIQIPVNASDTKVGDLLNAISGVLSKAGHDLQNVISLVNQTFTNVTDAAENFVINGIGALNPAKGSACWTEVNQAQQNFVKTVADNAKVCVYDVIYLVSRDLTLIDSIQTAINNVFQTGSVPVSLFFQITTALTAISADFSTITVVFPTCESTQLTRSILTLAPIGTLSLSCAFAG